jgi:hypothetical protein
MPQHQGQLGIGQLAVCHVEIRATHAARRYPEQYLARAGLGVRHGSLAKRRAGLVQQHGAHGEKLDG